jgi:hypothetical protein
MQALPPVKTAAGSFLIPEVLFRISESGMVSTITNVAMIPVIFQDLWFMVIGQK